MTTPSFNLHAIATTAGAIGVSHASEILRSQTSVLRRKLDTDKRKSAKIYKQNLEVKALTSKLT